MSHNNYGVRPALLAQYTIGVDIMENIFEQTYDMQMETLQLLVPDPVSSSTSSTKLI
jgi:hypothetical protein